MKHQQLRTEIINPVLKQLNLWSKEAADLMVGTALHESGGLKYITQMNNGPALSYYQIEPTTLDDLYDSYLNFRPRLMTALNNYLIPMLSHNDNLTMNVAYATAAARLQYLRKPEKIPSDLEGQAHYWKTHWNTELGRGTVEQYIESWNTYI